jgi:hypothetical protein
MHSARRTGWERTLVAALVLALVLALLASLGAGRAAAAWLAPADLAPANPAGKRVGAPSIAMARDGTTIVAFNHFDGANNRIGVAVRAPGAGFATVRDVSAPGEDASVPVVAVDRQGTATLAYRQGAAIVARSRPAGGDWGPITPALSGTPVARGPAIAVGDNGAAAVVWSRFAGGIERAEAAVRPAGDRPFGAALRVSPDGVTSLCEPPKIAMDAAGNVVALWTRRTSGGGDYHVESAVKAAGAAQFAAFETRSTPAGNSPCNIDLRMAPDGRATAMWDYNDIASPAVRYVAFADRSGPFASGAWSAPETRLANDAGQPLLAIDEAGNSGAVWVAGGQIVSAVRTGLGGFSPARPLSGATGAAGRRVKAVAAGANGDAITTFVSTSNNLEAVFAARRRAGAEFGEVTPLSAASAGGATIRFEGPDVALDDQGNAFAVWERHVGGADTSSAQVVAYDPVAPVLTGATVPAEATAGRAVAMSAAASDRMATPALRFDFGDGSGAGGTAVQHAYAEPGTYTVTVTATDAAGNAASTQRAVQVAPASPGQGPGPGPGPGPTIINRGPTGRKIVLATVSMRWNRLGNGRTQVVRLRVEALVGPETVKLACKGKGCRKRATRTVKKHGRRLDLTKHVKGMTLRPKARLTIAITRAGFIGRTVTYTMVKRRDPKKTIRCRAPGAKKPTRC